MATDDVTWVGGFGKTRMISLTKSATTSLSATEMYGQVISNYGQTDDAVITLAPAAEGLNFSVLLGTAVAKYYRLTPNTSDKIYIDGTADADGHYIGIASAVIGAALQFKAFQTGASAYDWFVSVVSGLWVME